MQLPAAVLLALTKEGPAPAPGGDDETTVKTSEKTAGEGEATAAGTDAGDAAGKAGMCLMARVCVHCFEYVVWMLMFLCVIFSTQVCVLPYVRPCGQECP